MSPIGQPSVRPARSPGPTAPADPTAPALVGLTAELAAGAGFPWHVHDQHQLSLAARGTLVIVVDGGAWVLPRSRALWLPAGTRHSVTADTTTRMLSLYAPPDRCPLTWSTPTAVAADGLLGELIIHLARTDLAPPERERAEAVLWDQMQPLSAAALPTPLPRDERALRVAQALLADVTDGRPLAEWGREVGASARTLTRLFASDTGLGFERWRTHARLTKALPLLAAGTAVATVARRVGYATPSAFVAAFHREIGTTPGRYFADPDQGAGRDPART